MCLTRIDEYNDKNNNMMWIKSISIAFYRKDVFKHAYHIITNRNIFNQVENYPVTDRSINMLSYWPAIEGNSHYSSKEAFYNFLNR